MVPDAQASEKVGGEEVVAGRKVHGVVDWSIAAVGFLVDHLCRDGKL